ncbi:prepronociceptin [Dromaius novaehollandiae]|uniref:prepronociceptin n=1 Tax=Dromaius novaehollandiae TaxID=8790 RepID=UPI00311F8619
MRAVLWDLLLLCLFAHVLGDCQRDCLSCDRHAYSQWDGFNVLVCVLECEGKAVPRATWELCAAASAGPQEEEEDDDDDNAAAAARPFEAESAGLRGAGPRPAVVAAARRAAQVSALLRQRAAEDGGSEASPEQPADIAAQRPGARPPAEPRRRAVPAARGVQKRYGGFIGVRKSARKWNNQKRFSEFLKQYLGMSPRSSEYDIAADLNEHNEI